MLIFIKLYITGKGALMRFGQRFGKRVFWNERARLYFIDQEDSDPTNTFTADKQSETRPKPRKSELYPGKVGPVDTERANSQWHEHYGRDISPSKMVLSALGIMLIFQEAAGMSLPFDFSQWQAVPGHPDQGDSLERGSKDFSEVADLLRKAVPTTWQGKAAQEHMVANSTLIDLAQQMVDLDRHMESIVKNHAECVTQTQLGLGAAQFFLIAAYPVVCILEKSWTTYHSAFHLAGLVCSWAIVTGSGLLVFCSTHAVDAVNKAHSVDYATVIHRADKVGWTDPPAPSEFAPPVSGWNSSGAVPGPAGGSSTISGTLISAFPPDWFSGAEQAATTTEQGIAWASGPAAPIMVGGRSASGHATNITGSAAASLTSAIQQRQREQQAAPEEATSIDDIEDVGASLDVPWSERAPIDVTAPKPARASQASNLAISCLT